MKKCCTDSSTPPPGVVQYGRRFGLLLLINKSRSSASIKIAQAARLHIVPLMIAVLEVATTVAGRWHESSGLFAAMAVVVLQSGNGRTHLQHHDVDGTGE